MKKRPKLNAIAQTSLRVYSEGILDCIGPEFPRERLSELFTDLDDYPSLEHDPGFQWMIGYVTAIGEVLDVLPETLLEETEKPIGLSWDVRRVEMKPHSMSCGILGSSKTTRFPGK
jgi:hypothetical protein